MTIKEAGGKQDDIAILEALASRGDVDAETREKIELEIRKMRASLKGESEAAYEINHHFALSKNYMVRPFLKSLFVKTAF